MDWSKPLLLCFLRYRVVPHAMRGTRHLLRQLLLFVVLRIIWDIPDHQGTAGGRGTFSEGHILSIHIHDTRPAMEGGM
jgi:hypothetical protein